jgi:hypothetical protein
VLSAGIDKRGILEFDLPALGGLVEVTNAMLEFDVNILTSSAGDYPMATLIGYAADRVATVDDATRTGPVVGQREITQLGTYAISLDSAWVASIMNSGADLGLLVMPSANGKQLGFYSTDWTFSSVLAPTLTIDYTVVPEPAGAAVVGLWVIGTMGRRRKRKGCN